QLKYPEKLDAYVPMWARLYKTDIIKTWNIFNRDLNEFPSECQLFNMEYSYHVEKAVYINKPMYHYRRYNHNSLTKQYRSDLMLKWENWMKFMENYLIKQNAPSDVWGAYYSRVCFSVIPLGGNALKMKSLIKTLREIRSVL